MKLFDEKFKVKVDLMSMWICKECYWICKECYLFPQTNKARWIKTTHKGAHMKCDSCEEFHTSFHEVTTEESLISQRTIKRMGRDKKVSTLLR